MNTYLYDFEGTSFELPVPLDWKFSYGCELPCDAFEITFVYDKSMLTIKRRRHGFAALCCGDRA